MKKILFSFISLLCFTNLYSQVNLQLLGHLAFPATTCAGVWQYVDSLGNEYALIGAGDGIAIVDVTDPANPVLKFNIPAASSLWRELKTHGHYCYSTTEGGGGLTIVNLQYLPDSVQSKVYTGDGAITGQLSSAHTCAIADGYLYVFGSNIGVGGAIICDLNIDPWNPQYLGEYNQEYIHDGYIRNDTLWAGEIYAGQFSVIDISNKSNPILLATQPTPGAFCHNTWLSDNGQTLFTTDEVGGAPLGSFDISDIANIELIDTYLTDSMPNEEVHNVRVLNDFLINPSYGSQITICDATRPGNIIEIASYPTGSYLCWDASPYLPSGNIIATDVGGGLYIFAPYYTPACYLEGLVTDSISGVPLNNASVKILSTVVQSQTDVTGNYKTGLPNPGTFNVEFSKQGYITKTISNVSLSTGILTQLDVQLVAFGLSGQVIEASGGNPIQNATVEIRVNGSIVTLTTNASGNFSTSSVNSGNTEITANKWGYISQCTNIITPTITTVTLALLDGIYDDFTFDFGWTVTGNASTGLWERAEPVGTYYLGNVVNPDSDVVSDCSELCFVTDNSGGGFNDFDVDDGFTQITSPVFDLTSYSNPFLNYSRWFKELGGTPNNADTLYIRLNNGFTNSLVEAISYNAPGSGTWVNHSAQISSLLTPTSNMQLTVYIEDKQGSGNPLECGFDKFQISEGPLSVNEIVNDERVFTVFPNPFNNELIIHNAFGVEIQELKIFDLSGRIVFEKNIFESDNKINLNLSFLQNGTYLLQMLSNKKSELIKIVKM